MSFPNAIVTWQCPERPSSVVEVMQSCANLLDYLCAVSSTENLRRPPSPNRKLFILFPGNPGVVHFYERFVELMSIRRFDVVVMGYAGHSLVDQNKDRIFDLQDQVETAEQFLKAVFTPYTLKWYGSHIYIGGHSIGAFVAVQMMTRFSSIKRCFSLCGVISKIEESPNGRRLFFINSNAILYSLVTRFLVLLLLMPRAFLTLLVRWNAPMLNHSLQQLIVRHLSRVLILNAFGMSRQEFQLLRDLDRPLLQSISDRMIFYYVKSDKWAPPSHAYEVKEACESAAGFVMESDESVPHAWCVSHNEKVIENGILPFI